MVRKLSNGQIESGRQHRQIVGSNFCAPVRDVDDGAGAHPGLAIEEKQSALLYVRPAD